MAHSKKQDITIGNGATPSLILASGNVPTADVSKQSQTSTSIASGSTKPVSIAEALSLLQTLCLDLRGLGCKPILAARKNCVYIIVQMPASIGEMSMGNGHIQIDNKPVVVL